MENSGIKSNTPRDVFLHLLNILTFYLSVISFITIYIQYINILFPDPLNFYYTSIANQVRIFTSVLVIAFPVYLLTSWLLGRALKENPRRREFQLRKWLLYFTLFAASVTVIVDLIILVYNFLSGELTLRFLSKVSVVLLVALAVFGYYIWDLRRKDAEISKTPKRLAWAVALVVLGSIAGGFFIVGTPAEQRDRRFDERRVSDLQTLQWRIFDHWRQKEKLPENLAELKDSISGFSAPTDPQTEEPYEYRVLDELTFELCAVFKTSSREFASSRQKTYQENWEHEKGRTCFERTIDPELHKAEYREGVIIPLPADLD